MPDSFDRACPFAKIELAEGVVSEPFLPSGDQSHKVGFATPLEKPV